MQYHRELIRTNNMSGATRGDLRPFNCRKSQRDEHGGQVFIVQVEGSLFSQQHYSSLRPANEVTYNRYIHTVV